MRNKKKDKIIIGAEVLLLCMIVGILGINAASSNPPSSGVNYNKNNHATVQSAINDLYSKVAYGDAMSSDILSGKKALVGGKQVVGTFACPSLANQTLGDATPKDIDQGKIAWVNGNRIIGNYRPFLFSPSSGDLIPMNTLAYDVKLGDYISYAPLRDKMWVSEEDGEGLSFTEFEPGIVNVWRVIRKNMDGTVDIVADQFPGGDRIQLRNGGTVYTQYISTLNRIARAYEHPHFTVGSRAMGYDSTKAKEIVEYGSEPDDGYLTDIELVEKALGSLNVPSTGKKGGSTYLLASRDIISFDKYDYVYVRLVYDGEVDRCRINRVEGDGAFTNATNRFFIRPIVVLRSDLKITGGDGTKDSPYTLGV